MTQEELNYIKDAFSQIIDDIAGNPDWYEAARAVASDLGTLERELGKKIAFPPSDFDEAAEKYCESNTTLGATCRACFRDGAEWVAGQGVTTESQFIKSRLRGKISLPLFLPDGEQFKEGDKVIVQIRKKA